MVNEPPVRVWFAVYVVYGVQGVLEAFVHADPVALRFVCFAVGSYCFVHLRFLVYVCQLVLS